MSHKSIRLLIQDTSTSLSTDIDFFYARTSDFNLVQDNKGPISVVLDQLNAIPQYTVDGVSNYMKAWLCSMAFYKYDLESSSPEQYAQILDETDSLVDKFFNKLNFYSIKADKILVQNVNQQSFIKATSKIMTGHIVTFTILAEDDFDYCKDDLDCVRTDECGDN